MWCADILESLTTQPHLSHSSPFPSSLTSPRFIAVETAGLGGQGILCHQGGCSDGAYRSHRGTVVSRLGRGREGGGDGRGRGRGWEREGMGGGKKDRSKLDKLR